MDAASARMRSAWASRRAISSSCFARQARSASVSSSSASYVKGVFLSLTPIASLSGSGARSATLGTGTTPDSSSAGSGNDASKRA